MGTENRKNTRVAAYAKAIHRATATPGYIRDLSSTGCQVAFVQPLTVRAGDMLEVTVIAEHDPTIPPFPLRLTARWSRADGIWFCVGGELAATGGSREQEGFEKLVAYYEQGGGGSTSGPGPTPGGASSAGPARGSRRRTREG
jgi:hypothetical protein